MNFSVATLMCTGSGAPDLRQSIHSYIAQMQPPLVSQWRTLAACISRVGGASQDLESAGRTLDLDIFADNSLDPLDFDMAQKRLVKVIEFVNTFKKWSDFA